MTRAPKSITGSKERICHYKTARADASADNKNVGDPTYIVSLLKLKCISPKRWDELAARRRGRSRAAAGAQNPAAIATIPYFDLVREMQSAYYLTDAGDTMSLGFPADNKNEC